MITLFDRSNWGSVRAVLLLILSAVVAAAQCRLVLNPLTGLLDCSTPDTSIYRYTGVLSGIPATCNLGDLSFITDATPGQNTYNCTAPNTWTQNLNSGAAGANVNLSNLTGVAINTSLLFQSAKDIGNATNPARNIFWYGGGTFGSTSMEFTGTPTGNRVWTFQDATDTVVGLGTTDTLGNKTLSSVILAGTTSFAVGHTIIGNLRTAGSGYSLGTSNGQYQDINLYGGGTWNSGTTNMRLTVNPTGNRVLTFPDTTDTLSAIGFAETLSGNKTFTGLLDASGATHTFPMKAGLNASKPATCTVGESYFATDATAGSNLLGCTSTNTWTAQGAVSGITQLTGDGTAGPGSGSVAFTLANSGVSAGSCGDTTHSCGLTIDAKGRITVQSNNAIASGGTGSAAAVVTLSFSATPTFTCPSASTGTVVAFQAASNLPITLTGNITSSTLATCTSGSILTFLFKEDGTGGRTVVMPTGFDAAPVNLAANVTTKLIYSYDGANGRLISAVSDAGYSFGSEIAAPGTPPAGDTFCWFDSTDHVGWECKANNSSSVFTMVPRSGTTTTQFLAQTATAGSPAYRAIANADLVGSGALTVNGQSIALGATGNVNSGAAAHSVALNQGAGSAMTGAAIGTAGRILIDQGASADPSFNAASGDVSAITSGGAFTVAKVNGTSVPTNSAADQLLGTTASATGAWASVPNCGDSSHALAYNTSTHAFSCQSVTGAAGSPTFPINPQTSTYQVLAADFSACKAITVASGTFTITLVASGSQPSNGQCIQVVNYGSGVVTIARSGQNINGGTASYLLQSGSATNPSMATVVSDGTNYFIGGGFTNSMTTAGDLIYGGTTGLPTRLATGTAKQILIAGTTPSYITFPDFHYSPSANCVNTTAGAGWSTTGSTPTPTCRAGTNNKDGYLLWGASDVGSFEIPIPNDWDGSTIDYTLDASSTDATNAHTIIMQASTACQKPDGSTTDDVAYNTAQAFSTITLNGNANRSWQASLSSATTTGCAAGSILRTKITRTSDTATNVEIWGVGVTFGRLLTLQAN